MRLGIYTNAGTGPGTLLAWTGDFTPAAGWNTHLVSAPVILPAGTYWLAYLPSSNSLSFEKANLGSGNVSVPFAYGDMPSQFPAGFASDSAQWSFYATLNP